MGGTNQKEAYAVDLNDILPKLEDIIKSEKLSSKLKISKDEYWERVGYGATHLKEQLGYNDEAYFVIDYGHPAYDYWFAYYLTISASYKIPLILNRHFQNSGFSIDFLGRLEFFVLKIIDYNVFHDVSDHLKQIVTWLDENNTRLENNSSTYSQTIHNNHVHITEANYHQEVHNYWNGTNNDKNVTETNKDSSESLEPRKVRTFVKYPFNEYLFEAIKLFCEDGSLSNLKNLLDKNNSNSRIVFVRSFKKKDFTKCLHHFIVKGWLGFGKGELASWIADNFSLRKSDETLDNFKKSSCNKWLHESSDESKDSQIKYQNWGKEE